MILSYCDISVTPAFQNLVTALTPTLGDSSNKEAYRDYMEYNGLLRSAEEIIAKKQNDYFSTIPKPAVTLTGGLTNELTMSKKDMFKDLGYKGIPNTTLSDNNIRILRERISKTNNQFEREGISKVYKIENLKQLGQSDNFTYDIKAYKGKLDVETKATRLSMDDLLNNKVPRLITQGTNQLLKDLQKNVRTVLLETGGLNADKNNTTGNARGDNKILGESIRGKLSNIDYFSFGELRDDGKNIFIENTRTAIDDITFEKFSGKSFQDILNSNNFSPKEKQLYIASRLFQSLYNNSLNNAIREKLFRGIQKFRKENPIILIDNKNNPAIAFVLDGNIYMNLAPMLDEFLTAKANNVRLDDFSDMIIFEELIHMVATTQIGLETYLPALGELSKNSEIIKKAFKYYGKDTSNESWEDFIGNPYKTKELYGVAHELFRAIVQKNILGVTSEDIRGGDNNYVFDLLNSIWQFLKDIFKDNKLSNSKKIVEQITSYIKDSELENLESLNVSNYSEDIIRKMSDVMQMQIGVDYAFISPQEATEITKMSKNPWNGQKSFFFQGKIYFIEGELTPSDVLHEFVHPIIKSLAKQNRSVFDNIWTKLLLTNEGKQLIEEVQILYPDFDINGDDFKEEVLVRSIEKIRDLNNKGLEVPSQFQKFIDNLLYSIKQFLRKAFGQKIRISELDQNTTLEQLSDMLKEGNIFELDQEVITDKDIVAYKNSYNQAIEEITAKNINAKELEDLANKYFDSVSKYLKNAQQKENLGELSDILYNEFGTGEFQKIKQNLKSYQTKIIQDAKVLEDEVELTRQRTQAVVNSLGNIDNMADHVYKGLRELVKDINDRDNIQQVQYYQGVLKYWGDFAKDARNILERNGVEVPLVNNIVANVDRANALVNDFYFKASKDALWDVLKETATNIDQKFKDRLAQLKAKNAPQSEIDRANKEWNNDKLTKDKLEAALNGSAKDVGILQSFLEAASYSPDPVYGGLASYIKTGLTEFEVKAQANFNDTVTTLKPLLDKVGYNPNTPGEIGEKLGQKEKIGYVNPETNEFEEKEVWRFINEFTGADLVRDKYQYDIRKVGEKYAETRSDEDRAKLAALQSDWEKHRRDYFNNEFTEDFYKLWDILRSDNVGQEARLRLNTLYDELGVLTGQLYGASADDVLDITDQIEIKRREIGQLSSLYDLAGELKTGEDLEIAMRIKQFNEKAKEIYESKEISDAFQLAYQSYQQKLMDEGKKPGSFEYEDRLTKWLEKNSRVVIKDTFWTRMDQINQAIKNILSELPEQQELNAEIDEAYKVLRDMVRGNRDEGGQPVGDELTPERQEKIKKAQETINEARKKITTVSGLSKIDQNRLDRIFAKDELGEKLTQEDQETLTELLNKQKDLRLGKFQRLALFNLFNELDSLRTKEPTDSYIDTVNNLLKGMNSEVLYEILGSLGIDKNNAYLLGNDYIVDRLMNLSQEFEDWFTRNHIIKEIVGMQENVPKTGWERTYAWNVIRPKDERYYEHTSVQNLQGEKVKIKGMPALKYYKRFVKDEFKTKKVEEQTVDNRGYWLPKTMAHGAKDDRYINKEYERLKTTNPDIYRLLEATKKIHLKNQQGLNNRAKLYLDFPRYRKGFVERVQSENVWQRFLDRIKQFYTKVKDGWDQGFNFDTNQQLVKLDLFDEGINEIPITGLSNLPIEEVSTDVIYGVLRYNISAEKNKVLSKLAPVAKAVQDVVNNKENYPIASKSLQNRTLVFMGRKRDKYTRAKAVNNYIERTFQGQSNTGLGSESAIAQNISKLLFKSASSAFLTLNVPSAIKNAVSAKFQTGIEATAGKHLTWAEFLAAEVDASTTTMSIMSEIYKNAPKSLNYQLVELFDPERDRFIHKYGESVTRTPGKDYGWLFLERLNDFRSTTQLQSNLQTFFGMMRHQLVKDKNGNNIMYKDAWEIKDGKIQLKSGIDPEWGITYKEDGTQVIGKKFVETRNRMNRVIDNVNGFMSREESPEAERYLAFRYVSFFRRFLTAMATNRFAKNRYDYTLGETKRGWYIEMWNLLTKALRSKGRSLLFLSPEEKQAALRLGTEVGTMLLISYLALPALFGWDPDDPDKYKKLKAKSDALPIPGLVIDDPRRDFDTLGWFSNHALLQFIQFRGENSMFFDVSTIKDYTSLKTLVAGPTLNSAVDVLNDTRYLITGDDRGYYQKTVGPYFTQEEGEVKILNHLAKVVGLTGSSIDPAITTRNYINAQSR